MKAGEKKIAIITWYNFGMNYGQTLQAYALQKVLSLQGYYAETLTYGFGIYSKITFLNNQKRKKRIGKQKAACQKKFDRFIRKNMFVSKPLCGKQDVELYLKKKRFDAVICGSDQIWNPYNIDSVYYLNLDINLKKIAYAPSIISEHFSDKFDEYPEVGEWVQKIDCLSVREKTGAGIIYKLSGVTPEIVLDPTLLLCGFEWEKLLERGEKPRGYIFCYLFDITESQKKFVVQLSQKIGVPKIIFADILMENNNYVETVKDLSPEGFLTLIKNADAVVTDSFHGTAFSILFQKEFYVIDNGVDDDSDKYYNIDRMITLLATVGLEERILNDVSINCIESIKKIDYSQVNGMLEMARHNSLDFLVNAINN